MELPVNKKHLIKIEDRRIIEIDGVEGIISFDPDYICLNTMAGRIEVEGRDLIIEDLSKETTRILITGTINQVSYKTQEKKKGLFR